MPSGLNFPCPYKLTSKYSFAFLSFFTPSTPQDLNFSLMIFITSSTRVGKFAEKTLFSEESKKFSSRFHPSFFIVSTNFFHEEIPK